MYTVSLAKKIETRDYSMSKRARDHYSMFSHCNNKRGSADPFTSMHCVVHIFTFAEGVTTIHVE